MIQLIFLSFRFKFVNEALDFMVLLLLLERLEVCNGVGCHVMYRMCRNRRFMSFSSYQIRIFTTFLVCFFMLKYSLTSNPKYHFDR